MYGKFAISFFLESAGKARMENFVPQKIVSAGFLVEDDKRVVSVVEIQDAFAGWPK